jgi:hypothetical protein
LGCAGDRMQNTQFGVARGGCLGKQVAEHIGYRVSSGAQRKARHES